MQKEIIRIRTYTREELLDVSTSFGRVLAGDRDAAYKFFANPKKPFYLEVSGEVAAGKALISDGIRVPFSSSAEAEEICKINEGFRDRIETSKTNLHGIPIEVQFQNINQPVTNSQGKTFYFPRSKIAAMKKQRTDGGITILQNADRENFYKRLTNVSIFLSRYNTHRSNTRSRSTRRRRAPYMPEVDTWARNLTFYVDVKTMQNFEMFNTFWAGLKQRQHELGLDTP